MVLDKFAVKVVSKFNMKDKIQFFQETVPAKLEQLTNDQKPEWGMLTPQAMAEHLVSSWRIANGKSAGECKMPEEKLQAYRDFLFSDQPFQKNIKNPLLPENEPPPLRKNNLQEAKDQLLKEIEDFFSFHDQNSGTKPIHPVFGPLDMEGWLIFQEKHTRHHFRQFGLLND